MKEKRNFRDECYSCIYKQEVPGNCHIKCSNPDLQMKGDPHGIKNNNNPNSCLHILDSIRTIFNPNKLGNYVSI